RRTREEREPAARVGLGTQAGRGGLTARPELEDAGGAGDEELEGPVRKTGDVSPAGAALPTRRDDLRRPGRAPSTKPPSGRGSPRVICQFPSLVRLASYGTPQPPQS